MIIWRADPALLHPGFRTDVEQFLEASRWTWYVLSTYRSMEEQRRLWENYKYRGGPRAAPPGRSAHNFGMAVDVVLDADSVKPGLQPSWDTKLPAWLWLKMATIPHPRLRGGWRFGDWPHIERVGWPTV